MADDAPAWPVEKYANRWPLDPNGKPEEWRAVLEFEAFGRWAATVPGLLRDCEVGDG